MTAEDPFAYVTLARNAERHPADAAVLAEVLGRDLQNRWEPALAAAFKIAEDELEHRAAVPVIDRTIAAWLRENSEPDEERVLQVVGELYNRIPRDTVILQETATEIFRLSVRAMERRGRVELHPDGYVDLINNYVARLLQNGAFDEAFSELGKAIELARERSKKGEQASETRLAQSLEHLAVAMGGLGRHAKGLGATDEALTVYRRLAEQTEFSPHRRDVARCLNNRITHLSRLGRNDEAIRSSTKSVALYRQLVAEQGQAIKDFSEGLDSWAKDERPSLGDALTALASVLGEAGRADEALAAAKEAVETFEELNDEAPDQFRHHLAMAHHSVAMALGRQERFEEAIGELGKALKILDLLIAMRPDMFTAMHAHVCGSRGVSAMRLSRLGEAIEWMSRAAETYTRLAEKHAGGYRAQATQWLSNLAALHTAAGDEDAARSAREQAAALAGGNESVASQENGPV